METASELEGEFGKSHWLRGGSNEIQQCQTQLAPSASGSLFWFESS
jgi:hypothetical protein